MSADVDEKSLAAATQMIGLDAKWLQAFDVEDPFNDKLRLRGFLCQKPDHRYGALALTHVGEAATPQLILATPKLHYPFGKDGAFHFPPIKKISLYEKLDGTNVLAYRYRDGDDQWRLTYKLRLAPTLRNSKWGLFLDRWQELLRQHPTIPQLVATNDCHISFEMYGGRNTHLIVYETELAVAALFGVRRDASIVPLFKLNLLGVPGTPLVGELIAGEDPVAKYAAIRAEMEQRNRHTEDEKLIGRLGACILNSSTQVETSAAKSVVVLWRFNTPLSKRETSSKSTTRRLTRFACARIRARISRLIGRPCSACFCANSSINENAVTGVLNSCAAISRNRVLITKACSAAFLASVIAASARNRSLTSS